MADTMEDVVEGGEFEATGEERELLESLRGKRISAKAVSERIDMAVNRPPPQAPPVEKTVTATEVRRMFTEYGQQAKQSARADQVQRDIKAAIGKQIDDSGLTKKPKRRDRIVEQVFESLCARDDVVKLNDDDFHKVLKDESDRAITDEREDDGTSPPPSTTPSTDEGRKTAAEKMGQTNGNEPPPKSAAQTNPPRPEGEFDVKDPQYGLDIKFRTDSAIQRDSSRKAKAFLKDRRKRQ